MKKKAHTAVATNPGDSNIVGGLTGKVDDDSILTDIIEQINESNLDLLSTINDDALSQKPMKKKVRKFSAKSTIQ
jgi:hypothetical protein